MESEDPPFENPFEKEYNRVVSELAQQREDCETKIEELQRRIGSSSEGAGDQGGGRNTLSGGQTPGHEVNSTHFTDREGSNHIGSGNRTDPSSSIGNFTGNNVTLVDHSGVVNSNVSYGPFDSSSGGNSDSGSGGNVTYHGPGFSNTTSSGVSNDTGSSGGCTPCPISPGVCGPSNRDFSSELATPEAVLLGAAATLILLVLAAAVAIIIRYLESFTSGLLIIAIIVLVWYCSSMYPEAARRLGTRILGALRSAATSVVDRLFRRNHPEVSVVV
jgi:hypothetical protein